MSHSSHRKAVRNVSLPLSHRASHARSCANHVAARLGVKRDFLLDRVVERTGVDLRNVIDEAELMRAFEVMEAMTRDDIA